MSKTLITLDGPSGVGKTTIGKRLAADLNLEFFSSGKTKDDNKIRIDNFLIKYTKPILKDFLKFIKFKLFFFCDCSSYKDFPVFIWP